MPRLPPTEIRLRRTEHADIQLLHAIGSDEESNRLAGTKPRDWPSFLARWSSILADTDGSSTRVTPRVIEADGVFVGSINIFPQDQLDSIGYWVARAHWGRGIASAAVALLLRECPTRPLHATVAGHNLASIHILQKHGFAIVDRRMTPETELAQARESVTLVLRSGMARSSDGVKRVRWWVSRSAHDRSSR
jgi:RimJ/RimL family protein N-acetyltransferase